MAVGTDRQYTEFCRIIGAEHLSQAPYSTNRGRVENRNALVPLLAPFMKSRTTAAWIEAFEAASVPSGPINSIDQVFDNPQVKARGIELLLTREDGTKVPSVANPIVFSNTKSSCTSASPTLGQSTQHILTGLLNLSAEDFVALKIKSVVS
jgi:crotonobetainyl-CoA:carnitine CoA-transferase CaiB-like acyl-CoA transferase